MNEWEPVSIEWVKIPAGKFIAGLSQEQNSQLHPPYQRKEFPVQEVDLPVFYISKYPITCWQFLQGVGKQHSEWEWYVKHYSNPSYTNHPIDCSFVDAQAFCEWIGARLPTSMEWEKAARGTDGRLYPWGNEWDWERGNFGQREYRGCKLGIRSSPVDAYPEGASPYGVMDMLGNGYEWTSTWNPKRYFYIPKGYILRGTEYDTGPGGVAASYWAHLDGDIGEPVPTGIRPAMDEQQYANWRGFPPPD